VDVNSDSALRTVRRQCDEGLLEFRRGRDVTVGDTPEHTAVIVRSRELAQLVHRQGFRSNELIESIASLQ